MDCKTKKKKENSKELGETRRRDGHEDGLHVRENHVKCEKVRK